MHAGAGQAPCTEGFMKQNERFLVYAVTGFLALILAVAVLFGREPVRDPGDLANGGPGGAGEVTGDAPKQGKLSGLQDILGTGQDGKEVAKSNPSTGAPSPEQVVPGHPLNTGGGLLLAPDIVAQQLGSSRRDRMVRFVRAKSGDSLDMLVRRWCGARDPYLAEAKCLNEDLVTLRVGQEVAVPWVDDEVLLTAIEAQKPKVVSDTRLAAANPVEASVAPGSVHPAFAEPGANAGNAGKENAISTSAASEYLVKQGDALWRIAERAYGKKNAARMVGEIKKANPGIDERLVPGQKLAMPAAPADR
jgi:phage tail protein X